MSDSQLTPEFVSLFGRGITVEKLRRCAAIMRANEMPPRLVKDETEAAEFTANDPTGKVWAVGEPYYLVTARQPMAVPPADGEVSP